MLVRIFTLPVFAVMLSGCVVDPQPPAQPLSLPNHDSCGAAAFQLYVGKRIDATLFENHPQIRVIRPGTMVTQDYRADRINWELDVVNRVQRVYCG